MFGVVLLLIVAMVVIRFQDDDPGTVDLRTDATASDDPDTGFTPEQDPAQVGRIQNETGAEPADRTLRFVGVGEQQTSPFTVSGGLLHMDFRFDGRNGFFSVKVFHVDHTGADQPNESVLAPQVGPISGAHHIVLPAGRYVLDIGTSGDDGSWHIELAYPTSADAGDGRLVGHGFEARVVEMQAGDHEVHFQQESSGESFDVEIFDWRGIRLPETTCGAAGFGGYDRVKTCTIPGDGPYFVNVQATSGWSIQF